VLAWARAARGAHGSDPVSPPAAVRRSNPILQPPQLQPARLLLLPLQIIMDGNRRWAKTRGKLAIAGHNAGADALLETIDACLEWGVRGVTAYAFSSENWRRSAEEVSALMGLLLRVIEMKTSDFAARGIRMLFIGRRDRLSEANVAAMER